MLRYGIVVLILAVGLVVAVPQLFQLKKSPGMPVVREETPTTRGVVYRIEREPRERARLLENLKRVEVGRSMYSVAELLGKPDEDNPFGSKERTPNISGFGWRYYLKRVDPGLTNIYDEYIGIEFDRTTRRVTKVEHVSP